MKTESLYRTAVAEVFRHRASALDFAEKYILTVIFSFFAIRMVTDYIDSGSFLNLLYLLDQVLVVTFILIRRRAAAITQRFGEWFAGFAGTFLPLLIAPVSSDSSLIPPIAAGLVMLAGFIIHVAAKLTLRRSFGVVAANRGIKASGPYRLVRHPMYTGYVIVQIGLLLAGPNLQNTVVILMCWSLYIVRIAAEERMLRADPLYQEMMTRTRFRLMPGIY